MPFFSFVKILFLFLFSFCTSQSDWIEKDLCEPAVENQNTALLSGVRNGTTGLSLTRMGGKSDIPTRLTGGVGRVEGLGAPSASGAGLRRDVPGPKPILKQPASAAARAAPKKQVSFGDDVGDGAARAPALQPRLGGAIREDAIPAGSKLEYLAPGRVRYDGVEFRAVRDLGHLSEAELREMALKGNAFKDFRDVPMHGHHHQQLPHRHPEGFVAEIPRDKHSYANKIQHPKPIGEGLPAEVRAEWDALRKDYYKERARTELLRRGVQ